GQTYGTLPTPTRANYTFNGWFTAASGGTQVTASTTVNLTAAQVLYAHWTAVKKAPGLSDLSYGFANSFAGLGYTNGYQIPYERFKMMFGNTMRAQIFWMAYSKWGGSCYGFSSTSSMFAQNALKTSDFRANASAPSQLQTGDKSAQLNLTVRELLEAMQISQYSTAVQSAIGRNKNKLNELCAAVAAYAQTGNDPVLLTVYGKEGGHAVVGYEIRKINDKQSYLMIYDSNYPNQECYITLTTDTAGNYTGWYYHLNDTYDWGSAFGGWISFVPYADFYKVWTDRNQQTANQVELLTVNGDVVIKDQTGTPVASLQNGELITTQPDIYPLVELAIPADGESSVKGTRSLWLPVEIYTVERKDAKLYAGNEGALMGGEAPQFEASITHVDQSAEVRTTATGFSFAVNDQENLNCIMFGEDVKEGHYNITFQSMLNEKTDKVEIGGSVMTHFMTLGMVNGQAMADTTSLVSIDSYLLNGKQVTANSENVATNATLFVAFAPGGGSGSMSTRKVADDGKFTLPDCEFSAPSPDARFTGWLINGKLYKVGQTLQVTENVTATAQWSGHGISGVTVSGNTVTVRFNQKVQKGEVVAVAAYSEQGQMLRCALLDTADDTTAALTLNTSGAAYLNAFLLSADNVPLCGPFRKALP
ncbi:MAG: InlB B-repeat-containing protein, partial [Oscillibacter sp.]|nr:InlB B-repeat-containing protein [Oscillibacter sp.]